MYERIRDERHALAVEFRAGPGCSYVKAYDSLRDAIEGALENEDSVLSVVEFRVNNPPFDVTHDFEDRLSDARGVRDEDAASWQAHQAGTRAMGRSGDAGRAL